MLETVLMVTDKFKTTSGIILKPKKSLVFTLFTLIYAFLLLLGEKRKKSDETGFNSLWQSSRRRQVTFNLFKKTIKRTIYE